MRSILSLTTFASVFGFISLSTGPLLAQEASAAAPATAAAAPAPATPAPAPAPAPAPSPAPATAAPAPAPATASAPATAPAPAPAAAAPAPATAAPAPAPATASAPQASTQEPPAEKKAEKEAKKDNPPPTLLGSKDDGLPVGGYGGFSLRGTSINDQAGLLLGMHGGVVLDRTLVVGLAGQALATEVYGPDFPSGNSTVFGFGYGGLMLRYQFFTKSPIYGSLGGTVGGGAFTLIEKVGDFEYEYHEPATGTVFFVAEPSLQIHANLTRWMRLTLDGSYRFVSGASAYGYDNSNLRGVAAGGALEFGWF